MQVAYVLVVMPFTAVNATRHAGYICACVSPITKPCTAVNVTRHAGNICACVSLITMPWKAGNGTRHAGKITDHHNLDSCERDAACNHADNICACTVYYRSLSSGKLSTGLGLQITSAFAIVINEP
jgi:hypothetical protein